jgi:hypothetical protein
MTRGARSSNVRCVAPAARAGHRQRSAVVCELSVPDYVARGANLKEPNSAATCPVFGRWLRRRAGLLVPLLQMWRGRNLDQPSDPARGMLNVDVGAVRVAEVEVEAGEFGSDRAVRRPARQSFSHSAVVFVTSARSMSAAFGLFITAPREITKGHRSRVSVPLEELHGTLVLHGGSAAGKGAEIATAAGPWIDLS